MDRDSVDLGALDPVLRNANVANPSTSSVTQEANKKSQQQTQHQQQHQLPLPLPSPWQSHQPGAPAPTQTHRQPSASFSPQTQGSTAPTPSDHATASGSTPTAHTSTSAPHHPASHTTPSSTTAVTPPTAAPLHPPTGTGPIPPADPNNPHLLDTHPLDPNDPNNPSSAHANKKPRACESCRGLKVRCDADPNDPDGPCRRCVKAKRACVVTQPTRKRQKKTDSRVAELEKKIDALTASLVAKGGGGQAHGGLAEAGRGEDDGQEQQGYGHESVVRYPPLEQQQLEQRMPQPVGGMPPPAVMAGAKRKFDDGREVGGEDDATALASQASCFVPPPPAASPAREHRPPDVVDKGHLTMGMANELFTRYTNQMCQHLPGVVFPPGTTAGEIRATKPTLFLAVMAAASSEKPTLQRILTYELMQLLGDKVFVQGSKNLELVQALQLSVIWYWPPERFEELKFYQLVHIAAVMAIEIGLGRKKHVKGGFRKHLSTAWRDHPLKKPSPPDPTTIEARRAWLTCYFLATNTAMALHRPNLIHWTPFIAECIDVLESSPEAAPTDKYLCHLVWTHKLAEEVGVQFSMDDPSTTPNIADARTQYALKGFERELEKYSSAIPLQLQQRKFSSVTFLILEMLTTVSSIPQDELPCPQLVHA